MSRALLVLAGILVGAPLRAEIPRAEVVLEVFAETLPGHVPEAAPPRFVLLPDGEVYVGGTSELRTGRADRRRLRELEKRLNALRKLPGLGSNVTLGPGSTRYRLQLRKGRPFEIVATGDPASAPPALRPLASVLQELAEFHDPALRPYAPTTFALAAREGELRGGCRRWRFPVTLSDALAAARPVPAAAAASWPRGAAPASVCEGEKTYVVTLRPLLPGETP